MRSSGDDSARPDLLLLPRRRVLRGGLAGLAAALMSPALGACDGPAGTDGGAGGGDGGSDAGSDAGADAGPSEFPPRTIPSPPPLESLIADIGPLGDPDANAVRLPPGFTSRVIGRSREMVAGTTYRWHTAPDGGSVFATEDGGWIYVSNSEAPIVGGVGAVRFDASGAIVGAYSILERTNINCAGGKTPWHTWLSCEESATGRVFETDPWGEVGAVERRALGIFKHEAVAVEPANMHLYLTEDEPDGNFYRFRPDRMTSRGFPDLESGTLEVASVDAEMRVTWHVVPDPEQQDGLATRRQVAEATAFDGGEGIWHHAGVVYFSTKGDTRVWAYDVSAATIRVIYDGEAIPSAPLNGVDNLTVSCCGDVLVAEDGGAMQIVAILPSGELKPLLQIVGHDGSEITGPAFDPSGTRLYFSSQRGSGDGGITYEVTGPFHRPA